MGSFWNINVRSGGFLGFFCSVGRSVDDKWVGIKLAKVVIHKNLILCVCVCDMYK